MVQPLAALSQAISAVVAGTVPLLSAIRIGPDRHMTGLVRDGGVVVTIDQELPALDRYTVVLSNGHLAAALPGPRDAGCNLAVLRLETPGPVVDPKPAVASVGNLVLVVAADSDASPTVRMTVIHRLLRTADRPMPVLDLPGDCLDPGSLIMDATGHLIGLAAFGPNREALAVPVAMFGRLLMPELSFAVPQINPAAPPVRRGWLGLALQPITVPGCLTARAGQVSGRMVVSITKGGPAETAGLRLGDVLLALNETSASGPRALRAFVGVERIGSTVEVRLLRDGSVRTAQLTIAAQPG